MSEATATRREAGYTTSVAAGFGATVVLALLSGVTAWPLVNGESAGPQVKLLWIGWVAFASMGGAAWVGARVPRRRARVLVWGYGLASGAMITSASVFLVPQAIAHDANFGGFGVALGLLVGFAGHTVGHRIAHYDLPLDRTVAELSAHAFSAGLIIRIVY